MQEPEKELGPHFFSLGRSTELAPTVGDVEPFASRLEQQNVSCDNMTRICHSPSVSSSDTDDRSSVSFSTMPDPHVATCPSSSPFREPSGAYTFHTSLSFTQKSGTSFGSTSMLYTLHNVKPAAVARQSDTLVSPYSSTCAEVT